MRTPCSASPFTTARASEASGVRSTKTMFVSGVMTSARGAREAVREPLRAPVIVGEARDVVVHGVKSRRGEDADLAHAAAPALASTPRGTDGVGGPGEDGADRRAQALREAYHHRVGARRPVGDRDAGGDTRVPEPRAVQVELEAALASERRELAQPYQRHHGAAGAVVRVL